MHRACMYACIQLAHLFDICLLFLPCASQTVKAGQPSNSSTLYERTLLRQFTCIARSEERLLCIAWSVSHGRYRMISIACSASHAQYRMLSIACSVSHGQKRGCSARVSLSPDAAPTLASLLPLQRCEGRLPPCGPAHTGA